MRTTHLTSSARARGLAPEPRKPTASSSPPAGATGAFAPEIGDRFAESATGARALLEAADFAASALRDLRAPSRELDRRLARAAKLVGWSEEAVRLLVCCWVTRDPRIIELPPDRALEAQVRALVLLARVVEASLWGRGPDRRLLCLAHVGSYGKPGRAVRAAARRTLEATASSAPSEASRIRGVPVKRGESVCAALVIRLRQADREEALAAVEDAAPAVGLVLERAGLLDRSAARENLLTEAANRRLARLTLDVHDGPLQDIVALLTDVRLYKAQLGRALPPMKNAGILLGRIDDFEARLLAIERELRELAQSFESPSVLERPLDEVVAAEVEILRGRTEAKTFVELGAGVKLTPSQRICIIRIVQEALANVRDHSDAQNVSVTVVQEDGYVHAEVVDDGCGFDVEPTIVRAARRGRLGLVGMAERVRLLGGTFDVLSHPGAGTTISVTLPEWRPLGLMDEGPEGGRVGRNDAGS